MKKQIQNIISMVWMSKEQRRINRNKREDERGYRWAAGELLCGVNTLEVEAYVYGRVDPFDRGAHSAISDWTMLKNSQHINAIRYQQKIKVLENKLRLAEAKFKKGATT